MGKTPDTPKVEKRPAPVTPESSDVKAAGDRQLQELRAKRGRGASYFTNPEMRTGFSGGFASKTGSAK